MVRLRRQVCGVAFGDHSHAFARRIVQPPRQEKIRGVGIVIVVRVRLRGGGAVESGIQRAVVAFAVKFHVVGFVEKRIAFASHENGLLHAPVENLYPARVNGGQRQSGPLQILIREAVNAALRHGDFIILLGKVNPLVAKGLRFASGKNQEAASNQQAGLGFWKDTVSDHGFSG